MVYQGGAVNKIIAGSGISVTNNGQGNVTVAVNGGTGAVTSFNSQTGAITLSPTNIAVPGSYTPLEIGNLGAGTFSIDVSGGNQQTPNVVVGGNDGTGTPASMTFYFQQITGTQVMLGILTPQSAITIGSAAVSSIVNYVATPNPPLNPLPPPANGAYFVGTYTYQYNDNVGDFNPTTGNFYTGVVTLRQPAGFAWVLTFWPGSGPTPNFNMFQANTKYILSRQHLIVYSTSASS